MVIPERTGFSGPQIVLHWTIAALVLFQLIFGESMTAVVDAAEEGVVPSAFDGRMGQLHYWTGLAILALVFVRIGFRLRHGAPDPAAVSSLAGKFASAVHGLFYALLVAVPVTGLLGYYLGDPWGELHTFGKPVFIGLIAVHAAAALFHQFWIRDNTLRRMLVREVR
jgi:cytochrome b561